MSHLMCCWNSFSISLLVWWFSISVQMKRNMAKLELYRKFTNSLAVSVLLSIAWIGFEVMNFVLYKMIFNHCIMIGYSWYIWADNMIKQHPMLMQFWIVLFQLYFNATDPLSELWQVYWIIPTFWTILAYFLLVVICILWAPSRNPTRYDIYSFSVHYFLLLPLVQ